MRTFSNQDPALAVALVVRGEEYFSEVRGLRSVSEGDLLTKNTVFPVNHFDRPLIAYAILQLVDEGKLKLNQEVEDILPKFPKFQHAIRVEDLLRQKSGLRDMYTLHCMKFGFENKPTTREQQLKMLYAQTELNFEPGRDSDDFFYGEVVLQEVIKEVSGKPFDEYMREMVFLPIGMKDACYLPRKQRLDHQAVYYSWGASGLEEDTPWEEYPWTPYLSISDCSQWAQHMTKAGAKGPSWWQRLISYGIPNDNYSAGILSFQVQNYGKDVMSIELSGLSDEGRRSGAAPTLAKVFFEDEVWFEEALEGDVRLGGRYGGRGAKGRQVLGPEYFKNLPGIYESPELDLRLEIKVEEEVLWVHFLGLDPVPLVGSRDSSSILECGHPGSETHRSTPMFKTLSLGAGEGQISEIRLSRFGVKNLLFRRVETD